MNERVKVISRDGVQLVELPPSMTLPDGEWTVRREGDALVLELDGRAKGSARALAALLATWEPLEEPFSEIEDPLPEPVKSWDENKDGGDQDLRAPR